ncbi:MAG: hypothetical protein HKM94_07360 [Halobacteria archaeon]|nr:hypothetical protein [Halobacteria archaeon]
MTQNPAEDDKPRTGIPYRVDIDGHLRDGSTDEEGFLKQPIEPDAKLARVFLGEPGEEEEYEFNLGKLPPITTIEGVQARLQNLGYYWGEINGKDDSALKAAVA